MPAWVSSPLRRSEFAPPTGSGVEGVSRRGNTPNHPVWPIRFALPRASLGGGRTGSKTIRNLPATRADIPGIVTFFVDRQEDSPLRVAIPSTAPPPRARVGVVTLLGLIAVGVALRVILLPSLPGFFGPGDPATY